MTSGAEDRFSGHSLPKRRIDGAVGGNSDLSAVAFHTHDALPGCYVVAPEKVVLEMMVSG